MAKKRRSKKKRRRRHARPWLTRLKKTVLQLIIITLCVFLSYCFYLDYQLRKEFEGIRWSIPARVYANPTELYLGQIRSPGKLRRMLLRIGYKPVDKITATGQFSLSGNTFHIFVREYRYWDTVQASRPLRLTIERGRIANIVDINNQQPLQIFRLEPELIGKIFPLHDEDRILTGADEIPEQLVQALIATEDRHFFSHHGIDPIAIARSAVRNIRAGKIEQGGSTLTQQLVKNMFLTKQRTFSRKINEILMALMLDYHYSKQQILTAYVNEVFLGQNGARSIHGFGTAAEFYFSRPLNELSLDQLALLAGMVKGASYYNPRRHPERALKRRNLVIALMHTQSMISSAEQDYASNRSLRIAEKPAWTSARYPAYLDLVRRHLRRDYDADDLRNHGLRIHTALDTDIQESLEKSVLSSLRKLDRQTGLPSGLLETAVLLVNQHNGEIQALVGDRNREENAFNRALDAKRPIGSLIKPAVYMTALARPAEYHMLSTLDDRPLAIRQANGENWTPNNYDRKPHGDVPLIRALAKSYNLSTVSLGMKLGLENVIATLHNLGIDTPVAALPSVLLGSLDLSPYQVSQMYQTIASGGQQIPLKTITSVMDANSQPLRRYDLTVREYIAPETAFLVQYMLTQVVEQGTARRIARELPSLLPLAGKTGTTNGLRDSWFAGFGDRLLGVVWLGRDDNKSTRLTGSGGAMQVWIDIMKRLKPNALVMLEPAKIEWKDYPDMLGNKQACRKPRSYPFVRGYVPSSIRCF